MKTLISLTALALFASCGMSEAEIMVTAGSDSDTSAEELGTVVNSYATLRHDQRKCASPMCGGYFVRDLNRVTVNEKYVSRLDFTQADLDAATEAMVTGGADGEVVVRGRLGKTETSFKTRPFIVLEAWRGMPGVTAATGELVYRVAPLDIQCFAAPCPTLQAKKVNYTATVNAHGVMTHRAALSALVDQAWMAARVERHDALVAAKIVDGARMGPGLEKILDSSQVFIRLPNKNGPCPLMRLALCDQGQVHTYARSDEACMMPTGCVTPGACAALVPACPDGYATASWSGGEFACPQYACDPAFLSAP